MPRPIVNQSPGADLLPLEYGVADVEAPDARYNGARVQVIEQAVRVMDRNFAEIGRYDLDEPPKYDDAGSLIGVVDGSPLIVRRSFECGCNGTRKVTL